MAVSSLSHSAGADDIQNAGSCPRELALARRLDQVFVCCHNWRNGACNVDPENSTGTCRMYLTAKPGELAGPDLEATVWSEIAKLQTEGPTQEEADAAQAVELTRRTYAGCSAFEASAGVADNFDSHNQYTGDP